MENLLSGTINGNGDMWLHVFDLLLLILFYGLLWSQESNFCQRHLYICSLQCLIKTYMSPERPFLYSLQSEQKCDVKSIEVLVMVLQFCMNKPWTYEPNFRADWSGEVGFFFYLIWIFIVNSLIWFSMLMPNTMMREQTFLKWKSEKLNLPEHFQLVFLSWNCKPRANLFK